MSSDAKGLWYWVKASTLFLGRGTLLIFGLLFFTLIIFDQFEDSLSLWEISASEAMFWFVLLGVSVRHYRRCRLANLKTPSIIYKPLRNIGWFFLIICSSFVLFLRIEGLDVLQELFEALLKPLVLFIYDLISISIVFACIYFASPKEKDNVEAAEPRRNRV